MALEKIEGVCLGKERDILYDITFPKEHNNNLIPIVFAHGFKGYKNWGAFNLVADEFAKNGFLFLKFNFSFNGTTKEHPCDFVDLEAFGNNNFTRELDDLGRIINFLVEDYANIIDAEKLTLMAHSRGGATAILKASEDSRIKKLITWASVGTIEGRIPKLDLQEFKRTNVLYVPNARTNQNMPIYYQFVEDYYNNENRFNLTKCAAKLHIPTLIIHGDKDTTVQLEEAQHLKNSIPNSKMLVIKNGGHSFGASEPWESKKLPSDLQEVVLRSMEFSKV